MGWHLDGRVTAMVGTHTHVRPPTGACCRRDGLHHRRRDDRAARRRHRRRQRAGDRGFVTHMREPFETSDDDPWLMGVLIRATQPLRADAIEQLLLPAAAEQHKDERREQRGVAQRDDEDDPGLAVDDVEVVARELDLRQRDARRDERAGQALPARPAERRERREPDDVLRAEDLPERDERQRPTRSPTATRSRRASGIAASGRRS